MLVYKIFHPLKKWLPAPVSKFIRSFFTATLTPFYFSWKSGHLRSSISDKPLDRFGRPLPWYTYATIHYLESKNLKNLSVLEFGAGYSTLWWSKHAAQVTAFEGDQRWFTYLNSIKPDNAHLHFIDQQMEKIPSILNNQTFDIVIVDGLDRFEAIKIGRRFLKEDGIIILDDSECTWSHDQSFPIIDFLHSEEFSRIDFHGHTPAVFRTKCTSIFFQRNSQIFRQLDYPPKKANY
jgi:hypothetical protein